MNLVMPSGHKFYTPTATQTSKGVRFGVETEPVKQESPKDEVSLLKQRVSDLQSNLFQTKIELSKLKETQKVDLETLLKPEMPVKPRTRMDVAKTLAQSFFKKELWYILIGGTFGGMIFAIGTPVMAVTIPGTIALMLGANLLLGKIPMLLADPNGKTVNRYYARKSLETKIEDKVKNIDFIKPIYKA